MKEQIIREMENYGWQQENKLLTLSANLRDAAYQIPGILSNVRERLGNLSGELDGESTATVNIFFEQMKVSVAALQSAHAAFAAVLPDLDSQSQQLELKDIPPVVIVDEDEYEEPEAPEADSDSDADSEADSGSEADSYGGDSADFIDAIV